MSRRRWSRVAAVLAILVCPVLLGGDEDLASRRERILAMSPDERAVIAKNQKWFNDLDPAEQRQIRQLHDDLQQADDGAQLRRIMHNYNRWLETLPSETRFGLHEMPAAERLERVKKLSRESRDKRGLRRWLEAFRSRMMPGATEGKLPRGPRGESDSRRPEDLRAFWFERFPRGRTDPPQRPPDEELAKLRGQLSPETAKELQSKSPDEQWRWVMGQLRDEFFQEMVTRRLSGRHSEVSDAELTTFFESQPDEIREQLLSLPGNEMHARLLELYQRRPAPGGRFSRQGPGPGPPPDDRPPGRRGPPRK
jgi:hypothetical protein